MAKTVRRALCALSLLLFLFSCAMAEVTITITDSDGSVEQVTSEPASGDAENSEGGASDAADSADALGGASAGDDGAREAFIDGIIDLAEEKFIAANGKAQRAHYSSDIYVCKNFTVYLFRQNAEKFRMAEYPDKPLVIPDNKPRDECTDYVYGVEWKDVPASDGNPFYVAASFRYDTNLSDEENHQLAREFLMQVQRGDYFQMAANYYYGVGAHSMIFIADYDPETDSVHWCDSNMRGDKRDGIRYGFVQFDAVREIDWFVDAFCRKKYGATIYRLRDDIIWAE